jgi:hypothetical protein
METRRGPRPLAPGTRGKAPGAEAAACREVARMRASAHFPPASERVLLGSAGRPYSPSIAELCRDGAPPSCRGPYGEHGGGSAASPRCSPASRAVPPRRKGRAAGCVDGGMLTPPDAFGPRPPCPGFCAQAGAEKARAVTTATPVRRCFILLILRCSRILKGRYRRPRPGGGFGGDVIRSRTLCAGHPS